MKKAYPKSEKEVVCFECNKPILSRDDILLIENSSVPYRHSLVPIHFDCYGEVFKKSPNKRPYKLPSLMTTRIALIFSILVGLVSLIMSIVNGNLVAGVMASTAVFLFAMIPFFTLLYYKNKANFIWDKFERSLPAT